MKPWLLEVNASPALNTDEPTDLLVKTVCQFRCFQLFAQHLVWFVRRCLTSSPLALSLLLEYIWLMCFRLLTCSIAYVERPSGLSRIAWRAAPARRHFNTQTQSERFLTLLWLMLSLWRVRFSLSLFPVVLWFHVSAVSMLTVLILCLIEILARTPSRPSSVGMFFLFVILLLVDCCVYPIW